MIHVGVLAFMLAPQEEHSQVTITGKRNEQRKMDVSWTKEELGTLDLVVILSLSIPCSVLLHSYLFVYLKDTSHIPLGCSCSYTPSISVVYILYWSYV